MAVKKSRKCSGFVIYSYLEDSAFVELKRIQNSKLGIYERGICQYKAYERGTFSVKTGI